MTAPAFTSGAVPTMLRGEPPGPVRIRPAPRPEDAVTSASEDFRDAPRVRAPLTFAVRGGAAPISIPSRPGEGSVHYEGDHERVVVPIADVRSKADELSLDRHGFALVRHRSGVDFYDDDQRTAVYEAEVAELLKRATGARDVIVFDHTIRADDGDTRARRKLREPVLMVHNDYTDRSARQRLRDLVGDEPAEELMRRRFAIINVWRGIGGTVETMPLALADARTIDPADLVPVERRAHERTGEIQHLNHNPGQQWCYLPRVEPDEAILIKCFDSDGGCARLSAHTAFEDPATPAGARPRESIETRTFVFF